MAGKAAADANLDLERGEVELVMEDGERLFVGLVEAERLLNRIATVVHERLRLHQQHLLAADTAFRDEASEFLLPRPEAMHFGDDVGSHHPDIVPVQRIFRARISEAHPDLHYDHLACAWRKKKPPTLSDERLQFSQSAEAQASSPPSAAWPSPSASSPSTVGTASAAAASSSSAFIADGATMVATVKSSSVFAGVTPSGSFTWLM